LSDELLNGEILDTISEARVITERWRKKYLPDGRQHDKAAELLRIPSACTTGPVSFQLANG
jgi:hypothetical protein